MDFTQAYEKWDTLPDVKLNINLGDGGEGPWGKDLSSLGPEFRDLYGMNNNPLQPEFRWQDIVRGREIRSESQRVHRRWNGQVGFVYVPSADREEGQKIREGLFEAAKPVGRANFFMPGRGFVLTEEEGQNEAILEALGDLVSDVEPPKEGWSPKIGQLLVLRRLKAFEEAEATFEDKSDLIFAGVGGWDTYLEAAFDGLEVVRRTGDPEKDVKAFFAQVQRLRDEQA